MPNQHACACPVCMPALFSAEYGSEQRTSDRHFAIRWGDDWRVRVYVDGERQRECDECQAGEDGWAAVCQDDELGRVHYCGCGSWHICRTVKRELVRVDAAWVIALAVT